MISGEQGLLLAVAGMLIAAGCVADQSGGISPGQPREIPAQTPTLPESYYAQSAGLQKPGSAPGPSQVGYDENPVQVSGFDSTLHYSNITNSSTSFRRKTVTISPVTTTQTPVTPVPSPVPVTSFTADPLSGDAPLTVHFQDTSNFNPTAWSWDFGDGNYSFLQHPEHTYTAEGNYTVRLIAVSDTVYSNCPCCYASRNITVYPFGRPEPDFTANLSEGLSPLAVQFNDTSRYPLLLLPVHWSWDFDDGSTSDLQNPVHTFTYGRDYNVSFTVSNPRGSRSVAKVISVYIPVTQFTSNVTLGYAPVAVSFTDTSLNSAHLPTDYHWNFDDGSGSDEQNPEHTLSSGGRFNVTFTVTSAAGTSTATHEIDVYTPDFSATPGYGGNPLAVLFRETGNGYPEPYSWYWDFGDGFFSDQRNMVHQYTAPGTYEVSLRVTGPAGTVRVTRPTAVTVT